MDDPQSAAVASSSTAAASKLDSMSKDELTKLVKKYTVLQKQNKTKIEELTSKLTNFENDLKLILEGQDVKIENCEPIVEEIRLKLKEYNDKNASIEEEKRVLNSQLNDRNIEIDNLKREIELNKSILEMLNNEIKILNKDGGNHRADRIIEEEDENDEKTVADYSKEIEEMTFYIDELKSELEAEHEKSADYYNEILSYKKQIEDFEDQYNNIIKEKENIFINLMNKFNLEFNLIVNFEFNDNNNKDIECLFNVLKTSLCEKYDDIKLKINEILLFFDIDSSQLVGYNFGELNEVISKIRVFLDDYFKISIGDENNNDKFKRFNTKLLDLIDLDKNFRSLNENLGLIEKKNGFKNYINELLLSNDSFKSLGYVLIESYSDPIKSEENDEKIVGNLTIFLKDLIELAKLDDVVEEKIDLVFNRYKNIEIINEFMTEFKIILLKHYSLISLQSKNFDEEKKIDVKELINLIYSLKDENFSFDSLKVENSTINELLNVFKEIYEKKSSSDSKDLINVNELERDDLKNERKRFESHILELEKANEEYQEFINYMQQIEELKTIENMKTSDNKFQIQLKNLIIKIVKENSVDLINNLIETFKNLETVNIDKLLNNFNFNQNVVDELKKYLDRQKHLIASLTEKESLVTVLQAKIEKNEKESMNERENFNKIITKYDFFSKTIIDLFNQIEKQDKLTQEFVNKFEEEVTSNGDAVLNDAKIQLKNGLSKHIDKVKQEINEINDKFSQEKDILIKNYEIKLKEHEGVTQKLHTDSLKTNVMQLELADYDRTINNLNAQLTNKEKILNETKQEVANLNSKISKLNNDIKTLEQEKQKIDDNSTKLKKVLVKVKKELAESKVHETEHHNQEAIFKAQIEKYTLEIENYKLQLAEFAGDKQKIFDKYQSMNNSCMSKIGDLQKRNESLETELSNLIENNNLLKSEYENYKIRVQHAFKKQKEQNAGDSSNVAVNSQNSIDSLNKEITQFKILIEQLNDKLNGSQLAVTMIEKEKEMLQNEYEHCLDRYTKLIGDTKTNELQIRQKYEDIIEVNRIKFTEIERQIEILKIENDQLRQAHKDHLKEFKSEQYKTIDLLQMELDETRREVKTLKEKDINREKIQKYEAQISQSSNETVKLQQQQQQQQMLQLVSKPSETSKLINTFEELLDSKPLQQEVVEQSSSASVIEINNLKEEISKLKIKLDHLTELLNESELNNLRLHEQINVLKEEIRRLERNQEREKSISNLEYLKNIVYKYLTFQSAQEKQQLLPVLCTILKLSQEEEEILSNSITSTKADNQQSSTWGSFIYNRFT
jgi:GRIP and coiled-coil domain-containing protein 2